MKLLLACVALCLLGRAHAQDDCVLNLKDVQLIPADGESIKLEYTGNIENIQITGLHAQHIKFEIKDGENKVEITLQEMKTYHESTESTPNARSLDYNLAYKCNGVDTTKDGLTIKLEFANIYDPECIKGCNGNKIEYTLPMPFPVIDLNLLQEIIFQDIDVYNVDLDVAISNSNFEVLAEKLGDSGMNKQFKLSMKPTVTITQPETLTITVTDKPAQATEKSITIEIDIKKDESTSMIEFEETTYTGEFRIDEAPLGFSLKAKIADHADTTFTVTGDHSDCFVAAYADEDVEVKSKACQLPYGKSVLNLELNAIQGGQTVSSAGLLITIVSKQFEQNAYVVEYTPGAPLGLNIKLLNTGNNDKVKCDSDQLICTNKDKTISCELVSDFQETMLKTKIHVYKEDDEKDKISVDVIIQSTLNPIKFTEINYEGTIALDKQITFTPNIETTKPCDTMTFDTGMNDEIEAKCAGNIITLSTTPNLKPITDPYLLLTLTAEIVSSKEKGSVTLLLNVEQEPEVQVKFTERVYQGTVDTKNNVNFDNGEGPSLENLSETPTISIETADSNFKAVWDTNKIVITVDGVLPSEMTVATFILQAKLADGTTDQTAIVLDIEPKDPASIIKFKENYYIGSFDNKNTIDIDPKIETVTNCESMDLVLNKFKDKFKAECSGTVITITITDDFDEITDQYLTLILTATEGDKTGSTTIVLDVKQDTEPGEIEFTQPKYEGTIAINKEISFTSEDPKLTGAFEKATLRIDEHEEYFKLDLEESGTIKITVEKYFPHTWKAVTFIMTAKTTTGDEAKTAILLNIEQDTTTLPPIEFTKIYYEGTFNNEEITVDPEIELKEDCSQMQLTLDPSDIFTPSCNGKSVVLAVNPTIKAVSSDPLVLTITATATDRAKGTATIVFNTPQQPEEPKMKFTKTLYQGSVDTKNNVKFDNGEGPSLENLSETPTISIETTDSNFKAVWDTEKIVITVDGVLPSDMTVATFILQAKLADGTTDQTAIVLDIEPKDPASIIKFKENYYIGSFDNKNTIDIDPMIETVTNCESMDLVLNDDEFNNDKFKAECSGTVITITVTDDFVSIIDQYLTLILTVTEGDKTGSTTIVLDVKQDPPTGEIEFTQPKYEGTIAINKEISFTSEDPKLTGASKEETTLTIDQHKDNFELVWEDSGTIKITVSKPLPADLKAAIFIMTAKTTKGDEAKTAILLNIEQDTTTLPPIEFTKIYYEGTFNNEEITVDPEIELKEDCSQMQLTLDPNNVFTPSCNGKSVELTVNPTIKAVTSDPLVLTITATATDRAKGTATIVFDIPQQPEEPKMKFTKTLYQGSVDTKNNVKFDNGEEPFLENLNETPTISIETADSNFKAVWDTDKIVITVDGVLPSDMAVARFILQAKLGDGTTDQTVIVLDIEPKEPVPIIEFKENYYIGSFDNENTIDIDPKIETVTNCESMDLDLNNDEFKAECSGTVITITITEDFVKINDQYLTLILTVTEGDKAGSTTIVLDVKQDTEPGEIEFTQPKYEGTIAIDNKISFTSEDPKLTGATEKPTLKIDQHKENFELDWESSGTIKITVKKSLPDDMKAVIFFITATTTEGDEAKTAILLNIEQDTTTPPPIEFTKIYYEGIFNNEEITEDPEIEIKEDCSLMQLTLDPDDIFTPSCKGKAVELNVKPNFKQITTSVMILTITATHTDRTKGTATIVFDVPQQPAEPEIKFTQTSYEGNVDIDGNVVFSGENPALVEYEGIPDLSVDKYAEYFEVVWDSEEEQIQITKIGDNIELNVVTFILTAMTSTGSTAETTIILTIAHDAGGDPPSPNPIKFSNALYSGTLQQEINKEWKITLNNGPITITSGQSNIHVDLDSEDPSTSEFTITEVVTDKEFVLTVTTGADFDESVKMVSFPIIATTTDEEGFTIVSLEIIRDTEEVPSGISFETYKIAHSKIEDDFTNWEVVTMKATSKDNQDEITYELTGITGVSIDPTTGVVIVTQRLPVGILELEITATGSHSKKTAEAPLVLVIIRDEDQPILDYKADYSHVIITLPEDQKTDQLVLPKPAFAEEEYGFCIEEYIPEIEDIFYIDNGDVKCRQFIREEPKLLEMEVPQFTVIVQQKKLTDIGDGKCPPESSRHKREIIEGIAMKEQYTPNEPHKTIITVKIEDINNNSPIMDTTRVVGYPNKNLVNYIQPPYLVKLHATDADSPDGNFGKITYSSLSPDQLEVNGESGEVYPTNAMYDDSDHVYTVQACDSNAEGQPEHCVPMILGVILLDTDHMATITVNKKIDEVESFLASVSTDKATVHLLFVNKMYQNAPVTMANPFQRHIRDTTEAPKRNLNAIIYALGETKEPLTLSEIKALFVDTENVVVTSTTVISSDEGSPGSSDDNVGLIVAVSIISVMLVAVLIGGAFLYRRMKNSNSIPYRSNLDNESSPSVSSGSIKTTEDLPDSKVEEKSSAGSSPVFGYKKKPAPLPPVFPTPPSAPSPPPEEKEEESDLQKIEFVKHPARISDGMLSKRIERRATGYPLNPSPSPATVDEILEIVDTDTQSDQSTLPPYKSPADDDLDSVMTEGTSKSVSFNKEVRHSILFDDPHDSDASI